MILCNFLKTESPYGFLTFPLPVFARSVPGHVRRHHPRAHDRCLRRSRHVQALPSLHLALDPPRLLSLLPLDLGWRLDTYEEVWDFAGGIVVHHRRLRRPRRRHGLPHRKKLEPELDTDPHNIPFVALGTALLWFGWFDLTVAPLLAANEQAGYALINTEISASCALFTWLMIEWAHKGKPTLVGACVGAIAGLATVTPAAGFVYPGPRWSSASRRPWCYFLIEVVKNKSRSRRCPRRVRRARHGWLSRHLSHRHPRG